MSKPSARHSLAATTMTTTTQTTIRRHSRNRLVLVGRGEAPRQPPPPAQESNTNTDHDDDELIDSSELAQRQPSKLTHGFWLRRYSGLHERPQLAASEIQQQEQQQVGLLTRWTNVMMLRGALSGRTRSADLAPGRSGSSSAPPISAASQTRATTCDSEEPVESPGGKQQRRQKKRASSRRQCPKRRTRAEANPNASSGQRGHSMGCPFCGWRSGALATSSSSHSSFSSSSVVSTGATPHKPHESVPEPEPKPDSGALPITTTIQQQHLETDENRLSPYGQMKRRLLGTGRKRRQQEQQQQHEHQRRGSERRSRGLRLAALLLSVSPQRRPRSQMKPASGGRGVAITSKTADYDKEVEGDEVEAGEISASEPPRVGLTLKLVHEQNDSKKGTATSTKPGGPAPEAGRYANETRAGGGISSSSCELTSDANELAAEARISQAGAWRKPIDLADLDGSNDDDGDEEENDDDDDDDGDLLKGDKQQQVAVGDGRQQAAASLVAVGDVGECKTTTTGGSSNSLLPLIRPLASSSSSLASSSMTAFNLQDSSQASTSQQHLVTINDEARDNELDSDGRQQQGQSEPRSTFDDGSRRATPSSPVAAATAIKLETERQPPGTDSTNNRSGQPLTRTARGRQSQINRPRSQPVSSQTASSNSTALADDAKKQSPTAATATTTTMTTTTSSSATASLKSNFKKLVKRQQSVDSYRMARDQRERQKREQRQQRAPGEMAAGDQGREAGRAGLLEMTGAKAGGSSGRKFSMRPLAMDELGAVAAVAAASAAGGAGVKVEICVDPYARPGSFVLPGEQVAEASAGGSEARQETGGDQAAIGRRGRHATSPTPPSTLSLLPIGGSGGGGGGIAGAPVGSCTSSNGSGSFASPATNHLLMGGGFSGCITPTYPTHHLPSPKYVSSSAFAAMQKKYSNASTISSLTGAESISYALIQDHQAGSEPHDLLASANNGATSNQPQANGGGCGYEQFEAGSGLSSLAASRRTSKQPLGAGGGGVEQAAPDQSRELAAGDSGGGGDGGDGLQDEAALAAARAAAADAQRRADLAEHIYDNKCGLGEDMKFLASLPEMCDITFLVGETREPVCAVKSVLGARSRVFHKILFGNRIKAEAEAEAEAAEAAGHEKAAIEPDDRRSSSPRTAGPLAVLASVGHTMASRTSSRSTSPNQQASAAAAGVGCNQQQQQQPRQWSVISDASGSGTKQRLERVVARADSSLAGGGRSGRVSVASNGRESISQASQSSQQPLIIGPGQTAQAAPARRGKKLRRHEESAQIPASGHHSRLSRMFTSKRASDPSIKHQASVGAAPGSGKGTRDGQPSGSGAPGANSAAVGQSYLDKMSSSQRSTTMIIEEFEPDVFRQLIEYIHTGCVLLQARTLLGLLNAADYYGLEQLRRACLRFVSCCITVDTVCSLLSTAERYIQYKCTKSIVQKVLEFVDTHANDIFKLNAFGLLPEHVVRLILARDGLQADELIKYNGVYTWCEHYCRSYELTNMSEVMSNFLGLIQFHKIPTNVLLTEIYPTHIVPDEIFLSALAYQADPEVFEPRPSRQRRMTLPTTLMLARGDDSKSQSERLAGDQREGQAVGSALVRNQANRRSVLGTRFGSKAAGRKGSIAQASISGVRRISQRLPLRKRHSNVTSGALAGGKQADKLGLLRTSTPSPQLPTRHGQSTSTPPPPPLPSGAKSPNPTEPLHQTFSVEVGAAAKLSKQHSSLTQHSLPRARNEEPPAPETPVPSATEIALEMAATLASSQDHAARNPIQLGRQILDAYLAAKRQEEFAQRLREEAEAAERDKTYSDQDELNGESESRSTSAAAAGNNRHPPLVKTPSSTKKSFRDFKHISRRLFMRHATSKSIQVQQVASVTGAANFQGAKRISSAESGHDAVQSHFDKRSSNDQIQHKQLAQVAQRESKNRKLLRIKRSETVFDATPSRARMSGQEFAISGSGGGGARKLLHQFSANLKKG